MEEVGKRALFVSKEAWSRVRLLRLKKFQLTYVDKT